MSPRRSRVWYAVIALVVFAIAQLVYELPLVRLLEVVPRVSHAIKTGINVALVLAGLAVAHRCGIRGAAAELGMREPIGRGFAFALLATAPMLIAFAATSSVASQLSSLEMIGTGLVAPLGEEILFRAYLFRQLYRRAGLGFWISVLVPTILFAAGHAYQSSDPWELAAILAITGSGNILFSWVYIRWRDNFWPIFALHALMNLWWELFAIDETALGGWLANGARSITIVLAILLTLFNDRIWKRSQVVERAEPLEPLPR